MEKRIETKLILKEIERKIEKLEKTKDIANREYLRGYALGLSTALYMLNEITREEENEIDDRIFSV